ncbi:MAG TPA: CheR family methyltransferase, partial [Myxococcota bacterium]|nr:CheR family methyltransferase [Myxococcota bacterium]
MQQDMAIRPNHVYMIPPNRFLGIDGAHLKLDRTRTDGGLRLPIDHFLTSLARSRENRAVAIILSGTGADGSMGIRQVKALGGMVLAQQPETAEFGGMPQAAIATGVVDFVLPIAEMPQAVTRYASHPYVEQADQRLLAETSPEDFAAVLAVLRTHASHDFRCYKKGTLNRRIQRRMGLHQLPSLSAYVSMLRAEPAEVQSLVKDLLIGVTKFQRDREAWRDLERKILPPMIESKGPDDTVRAWVPGCSSGEEAYSIAMLMDEAIRRQRKNLGIQIFATDLDPDAVEFARAGLYPSSSVDELPPDLLARHFEASGDQYRVHKRLRDSVVFAVQNLISDPPFSNLDLISCRNVLIYLEPELQHRLLDMFHFSLRSGGCLFLGNSESTGTRRHLFEEVSKQWRLYTRKDGSRSLPVRPRGASSPSPHLPGPALPPERAPRPSRVEIARRMMLDTFVPPSVVVDGSFMIEYFHGSVRDHLDFPRGEMTSDLLEMAPPKLRGRLRTAIQEASTNRAEVQVTAQSTVGDGSPRTVRIAVRPIPAGVEAEPRFLVTFMTETTEPKRPARRGTAPAEDGDAAISGSGSGRSRRSGRNQTRLRDLEGELLSTKEDLQSTIEELEASNEELKASNEEVMSMNEELQSANEELETGREELQSLNEELNTVNNQLEEKVDEIEASNN